MVSKFHNPPGADEKNAQAVVKLKTAEPQVNEVIMANLKTEAHCFKPKTGSVFPAKRRLVKTMVFHSILKFVASGFSSIRKANPSSLPHPKIPNAKMSNQNQVVPDCDEQLAVHNG